MSMSFKLLLSSSLAAAILLTAACSRENHSSSAPNTIIGDDDRIENQDDILESTVGQLIVYGQKCTAFVSGPNELTTAAHCIDEDTDNKLAIQFILRDQKITSGIRVVSLDHSSDLAKLQVSRSFHSYLKPGRSIDGPVRLAGLEPSGDRRILSSECRLSHSETLGLLTHQCDTVEGMSGAPILNGNYVVGMHLGMAKDRQFNVALDLLTPRDGSMPDVREAEYLFERCWTDCIVSKVGDAISGAAADLSGGILRFGNQTLRTLEGSGKSIRNIANRGIPNISVSDAILLAAAVVYGAECIASDGTAPGTPIDGKAYCSANACACATLSVAILIKRHQNGMDSSAKSEIEKLTLNQRFSDLVDTEAVARQVEPQMLNWAEGYFRMEGKPEVYYTNGVNAYCWVPSEEKLGANVPQIVSVDIPTTLAKREYHGPCR